MPPTLLTLLAVAVLGAATAGAAEPLRTIRVEVDGVRREALLSVPAPEPGTPRPVVFVFHGHGQDAQAAAEAFRIHEHWPEALCVYPQGLPTPTPSDPEGRLSGWQRTAGEHGDRDLKFFDAVLARLRKRHGVDGRRVCAAGFSNGGRFAFLLWAECDESLAALAVCGSQAGPGVADLRAKPCLHVAGRQDEVVAFDRQQRTMEAVRRLNGCAATGERWNKGSRVTATRYASPSDTPFVSVEHAGGHEVPAAVGRLMSRFFREHAGPWATRRGQETSQGGLSPGDVAARDLRTRPWVRP